MRTLVGLVVVVMVAAGCGDDASDTGGAGSSTEVTDGSGATSAPAATSTTAASTTTSSSSASTTSTTPATPTTSTPAIELAGRTFVSSELTGFEAPAGTQLTFTFEADRFSVTGGCNQLMSSWALEGDVLVVGDVAATKMACEPAALMDLDTWVSALLSSDPTVALDGDTLILTEGQSSITLVAS